MIPFVQFLKLIKFAFGASYSTSEIKEDYVGTDTSFVDRIFKGFNNLIETVNEFTIVSIALYGCSFQKARKNIQSGTFEDTTTYSSLLTVWISVFSVMLIVGGVGYFAVVEGTANILGSNDWPIGITIALVFFI